MRIKAQAQSTLAGQLRIDDLVMFNSWLDAREAGDRELAAIYRRRFRPAFVPAFEAWMAQRPFTSRERGPGPAVHAGVPARRRRRAPRSSTPGRTSSIATGTTAKTNDDHYILSTLFFAAVLFFAGISLRLDWRPLRYVVLGMGTVLLLVGVGYVLTLPVV